MHFKKKITLKITFFFVLILLFSNKLHADLVKPNNGIEPIQVVKIQLRSLKENDQPNLDNGIVQTWEFAHPTNQKYTGPLKNFKQMIKSKSYSMLLNHIEHKVIETFLSNNLATYEVIILDKNKKYYKFKWQVEKYEIDGPLKDCWLTTAVSQPEPMGSSI